MKQVASLLFSLWVMLLLAAFPRVNYAQTPEKFSYQAVIRDNLNQLVLNQTIGFQISILQGSATGTPVYVETQTPLSNANGLISLEVGTGIVVSGDFTSIDWSAGPYFIKTEADPSGGTGYTITGVSQLISVPYALHAKTAQEVTGPITETDPVFSASPASGITTSNITNWNSAFGWGDHTGLYRPVSWNPSWLDVTGKPTTVSGYGITDAMTTSHAASSITGTNLINWSTAFGWGNHATAGYLTSFTETDPAFSASPAGGITASNISNWNTVYGWGNHATAGYMTSFTETDPAFSVSPAGGITASNISNWNTVYGWGNHATAGYMTSFTETDPAFSASPAGGITTGNISNWNTVYGWGNHATAGYLTSFTETDPAFSASPAGGITAGNISNWNTVYGWGNHATAGYLTSFTETDPTWSGSANTIYDIGRMGNVGIGTMSPATQLHTTGSVRFAGAGTPGAGKVLTSDADGNATWETPTGGGVMPSGNSSNTLRHNGTNWVANDLLRNDGTGLGVGTNPVANTQLRLARPNGNFGAGYTNIYASRAGDPVAANGGTSWSRSGVDAAIKGFSDYGNNFSAAVAGYGYLDYANSAALIGSNFAGTTYGGLAFKDANSVLWAGYFKGNINVTGSMFIETGNIGVGTNNPDARMEIAGTGVQGLRLKSISTTIPGEVYIDFMREGNNYYDWRIRNTGGDLRFSWSDDDLTTVNDLMTLRHTLGRVGIGTTSPLAQLHTTGTVRLAGAGTPGEGKVLTSDANGNATWEPLRVQVGDFAHGGIVFHVEPCGTKGLVCAKADQGIDIGWCPGTYGNTQAKGDGLYAGKANTSIIIAAHVAIGDNGDPYAARICNELQITEGGITYGDWYLPSKAELNLMYLNKTIINATALANGGTAFFNSSGYQYWSSTEHTSLWAWGQTFFSGVQNSYSKYQSYGNYGFVRAVRAF